MTPSLFYKNCGEAENPHPRIMAFAKEAQEPRRFSLSRN